jgi:hypothetical protein
MAAPGTMICSINDKEEGIVNVEDIPTTQNSVDYYLSSPTINMKNTLLPCKNLHLLYQTTFNIMKNRPFMTWLQTHRIFLEENDLPTTLLATVGMVFFVHPWPSMMENYHEQFKVMFIGREVP